MSKFNDDTGWPLLDLALGELNQMGYGSNFSISQKKKTIRKFGRRSSMTNGTVNTIWESPANDETHLTYAQGNLIDTMSSSSAADVGDTIIIEGHYINAAGLIVFHIQSVTANGQNKVTLSQPLWRVNRMYHLDTTPGVGAQYVYEDTTISGGVPTDTTKIHISIPGNSTENQSFKAATATSSEDALIITALTFGVQRQNAGNIDYRIESRNARQGNVFLPVHGRFPVNSVGSTEVRVNLQPPIIIPPEHDVRIRGTAGAASMTGTASFSGYFAIRSSPL